MTGLKTPSKSGHAERKVNISSAKLRKKQRKQRPIRRPRNDGMQSGTVSCQTSSTSCLSLYSLIAVATFEMGCKVAQTDLYSGTSDGPAKRPAKSKTTSWAVNALSKIRADRAATAIEEASDHEDEQDETSQSSLGAKPDRSQSKTNHDWVLGDLDNHHIYRDMTGFDYDVTLTRIDIAKNSNERYQLRVCSL